MPRDMQIVNNAVCLRTFHSISNSFPILFPSLPFVIEQSDPSGKWMFENAQFVPRHFFLSTDYILLFLFFSFSFFSPKQIFKQQPDCDALLTIKKTHTQNPDSGWGGGAEVEESLTNIPLKIYLKISS